LNSFAVKGDAAIIDAQLARCGVMVGTLAQACSPL
jgi:hypothetical protein